MYTRVPSGRIPRGMRVPENYSGNAFRPPSAPKKSTENSAPDTRPSEPREEPLSPSFPKSLSDEVPRMTNAPEHPIDEEARKEAQEPQTDASQPNESATQSMARSAPFGLRLPFFSGHSSSAGLSIGIEELLLIGLILLISQEGKNDDLVWLLLLLLFIP